MCSSFYEIPFGILIKDVLRSSNSTISAARARGQDFGQIIVPVFLYVGLDQTRSLCDRTIFVHPR